MPVPSAAVTDPTAFQKMADRLLNRIPLPENQALIRRYIRERRVKGLKLGTILSDLNGLVAFCLAIGSKSLEREVVRDDILDYLMTASRERIWRNADTTGRETITKKQIPLKASTLAHRKIVLRAFYKWLRATPHYPPEVADLGGRPRDQGSIVADRLIGNDEMKRLIASQWDARRKAILAVLFETGLRAQEFCSLNIGSVRFDGRVGYLRLPKDAPGLKTGAREVFIIDATPYLMAWLAEHPYGEQPQAPLFVSMSRRNPKARFTNGALYSFCIRAGKAATLPMDTHPHLFRHSSATEKARLGWNESQMRHYFGWTSSSDMPSRYVHLAASEVVVMEKARRGMLEEHDKPQPALAGIVCKTCKAANLPTAAFCAQCLMPVSPDAAAEAKRRHMEALSEHTLALVKARVDEILAARSGLSSGAPGVLV